VEQTAPTDLPGLFTLALMAGNDSLARAVVQRRLTLATDGKERREVLKWAVAGYTSAEPARLTEALAVAAYADTLALREHTNSLEVHQPLLAIAWRTFDQSRIADETQHMLALGHTLAFSAIKYEDVPLIFAWMRRLEVAFVRQPDSVLSLAQQAKTDLSRFPVGGGPDWPPGVPYNLILQTFDFKKHTAEQVRDWFLPFHPALYTGIHAIPPVDADFWFPARPDAWPPTGHVSLILYGDVLMGCARRTGNTLENLLGRTCGPWYTYFPMWISRYGQQGFAMTAIEQTDRQAVRTGLLTPSAEADSLNWFYRTYLHLPMTLAVDIRHTILQLPEPDGRMLSEDTTAFGRRFQQNGIVLLFGREGDLLYAGPWDRVLLQALIPRALAKQ
jgi:hypothetical protein